MAFLAPDQNQNCHSEPSVTNVTETSGWEGRRKKDAELVDFFLSLFLPSEDEMMICHVGRCFNPAKADIQTCNRYVPSLGEWR